MADEQQQQQTEAAEPKVVAEVAVQIVDLGNGQQHVGVSSTLDNPYTTLGLLDAGADFVRRGAFPAQPTARQREQSRIQVANGGDVAAVEASRTRQ